MKLRLGRDIGVRSDEYQIIVWDEGNSLTLY